MDRHIHRIQACVSVCLLGAALLIAGCSARRPVVAANSGAPTLSGDPAHPGQTQGWVDTRLYFGLGPAGHAEQGISEARWHEFLDREVSPRFPDGFSVLDVYGQWLSKNQTVPERLRTKMLVVDYLDSQENRAKVDAIRAAWKKITGDQSVLRVTQPADVSF